MFFWLFSFTYAQSNTSVQINKARASYLQGDQESTIAITKKLLRNKKVYGTDKDISRYLLASALEQQESYLLAAEQYQKIYWGGRALKKEALFSRAQNLSKGQDYKGVLSSCHTFRNKWPQHEYADSCLLLLGKAHGHLGNISKMRYHFQQYLNKHTKSPKAESIRAQQAIFAYQHNHKRAKEELRYLYLNHSYPSTAAQIRKTLTEEELTPKNIQEESQYIWSLIRSGFLEEAWERTQNISNTFADDNSAETWLNENLTQISWYTRSYDTYLERRKVEYTESPSGLIAWKIFHAYARSGQWKEAAEWGDEMLITYKRRGRWAGAKDNVARAHMFQRNYGRAAELWGEKKGKKAQFYTAFCTYMNGEYEKSIQLFEKMRKRTDAWGVAANYWTGKAKEKLGQDPLEHFEHVKTNDNTHWYRLLLEQSEELPTPQTTVFDGQWKQKKQQPTSKIDGVFRNDSLSYPQPIVVDKTLDSYLSKKREIQWNNSVKQPEYIVSTKNNIPTPTHPFSGSDLPNSYDNLPFSTDETIEKAFIQLIARKGKAVPELKEIYALAKAGNYPIAAYKLNAIYDMWKENTGEAQIRSIVSKEIEWLQYMIFVQSHHHVMRYTMMSSTETDASSAMKELNFPIVHPHYVWSLSKDYQIDPLLMHSILRAESTYREFIVSWAGAIGYVQVMPKTGAKVAHLLNE